MAAPTTLFPFNGTEGSAGIVATETAASETTYTWNPTNPGQIVNWNTPSDWLPSVVPDSASADVVIPEITDSNGSPYTFFITISANTNYDVNSLSIVDNFLILDGTLSVGTDLTLGQGSELDMAGSLAIGSLINAGADDIQGSGQISSPGSIDNEGEIVGDGLTLDFAGLQNVGTLIAETGSLEVDLTSGSGGFANLSNGTLGPGTYEATSAGVLDLNVGAAIVTDAANIILEGGGIIETSSGTDGAADSITQTLQTISPTGTLTLQSGAFAGALPLVDDGVVQLNSGTLTTPGLTVAPGGTVTGGGTITGPLTNNGVVEAGPPGSGVLAGAISGTGTLMVSSGNTLEIAGAAMNAVAFNDWNGVLELGGPTQFDGSISGFTVGVNQIATDEGPEYVANSDTIILGGISISAISGVSYTGTAAKGTLTLQEASGTIALNFTGDYVPGDFILAAGPQALSSSPPSVKITEVPLVITGAAADQTVTNQKTIAPFSRVAISDPNAADTVTMNVTLSAPANGTLTNLGGGTYDATTGVYTDTGSVATVTTALDALVFVPTAFQVAPNQTLTTGFTINVTDTAGVSATDSSTSVITTEITPNDAIVLTGPQAEYEIADDNGSLYIQATGAAGTGTQILPGITEIAFTDGIGVFDPTGAAEDVARLYGAAFTRAPDLVGLQYWTTEIDSANASLTTVANDFAASPEFIQDYGTLTDAAFVNQLYENVLGRPADASGATYWDGVLTSGATRGAVLVGFAESQENEANTISTSGDPTSAEVYRLYEATLGRAPDPSGQAYWVSALATGTPPSQVAQDLVSSSEFQQDYGTLSPSDFVSTLYENVLHRAADPTGLQYWTNTLQQGTNPASVVLSFADSAENRAQTAGATHANWVFIPT